MIDHGHALLPIALDCLHYQKSERPSSEELCQRLACLKDSSEYRENIKQVDEMQRHEAEAEKQKETARIKQLHDEIQSRDNQLQEKESQLQEKKSQLQRKKDEIVSQEKQIRQQERQLRQLNQQLEKQQQVTAEIQQSLQRQVEQLQQKLSQQNEQMQSSLQMVFPQTDTHQQLSQQNQQLVKQSLVPLAPSQTKYQQLNQQNGQQIQQLVKQSSVSWTLPQTDHQQSKLSQRHFSSSLPLAFSHPPKSSTRGEMSLGGWRARLQGAPFRMVNGDSVVSENMAYFMNIDGKICSYNSSSKEWSKLPACPYQCSSLAVINGLITSVGGCKTLFGSPDNKLFSLMNAKKNKEWVEQFPPMPTKRYCTATVTTKHHLIVVGGRSGLSNHLDTVEVMDIQTLIWSVAARLPHPYSSASITVCGDNHLYILGGIKDNYLNSNSVLTCSLTNLLQSCSETLSDPVWHRIADVPVYYSTCAAVNGELVAVGGVDASDMTASAVHKYNPTTNSWDLISHMPTARHDCLVAVLPTNKLMAVGGFKVLTKNITDKVEIASIS